MNRVEMINEIELASADMSIEFEDIKVKKEHLDLPSEAKDFPRDMVEEGYKWIVAIWNDQFAAVRAVRNLLTKDQWKRYKLWDSFGYTQEMKLLKEKQIPFRKAIVDRNRPDLFKKGKQNEQIKAKNSKKG